MEDFAPMLMLMTLYMTIAAVILLRPIARHLGEYLRVLAEQRAFRSTGSDESRLENLLVSIDSRLSLLEERQRFSEALLDSRHASVRPRTVLIGEDGRDGSKLGLPVASEGHT